MKETRQSIRKLFKKTRVCFFYWENTLANLLTDEIFYIIKIK